MVVTALALIGVFVAVYLLLYNLGALGTIACGVGGGCETVQATKFAYFLGIPVAAWGLATYLGILIVAFAGSQPRFAADPWVAWSLLGLTSIAFLFSAYLTGLEAWVIRAWCRWCVISAILATLMFVFSWPEIGRLRSGSDRGGGE